MFRNPSNQKTSNGIGLNTVLLGSAVLGAVGVIGFSIFKKNQQAKSRFATQLKDYHELHYGKFDLSKLVVKQLSWLPETVIHTSDSNAKLSSSDKFNIEVKRALSRWNNLKLLQEGNQTAYRNFVLKQPESEKLNFATFQIISQLIKNLSPSAYEAVTASCFITMTDKAKRFAREEGIAYSEDSEKFLTDTITKCPSIYPLWDEISSGAKALMPYVFLKDTHARHMLYTEGGNNMFAVLKEGIKNRQISKEQYEVWFCRWLINIVGFRGHVEPAGSIYFTQNTADCLMDLKNELDKLWINSDYDVMEGYLKKRAERLKVKSLFLSHLASQMRLYSPEEGAELQKWFDGIGEEMRSKYEAEFRQFCEQTKITSTYGPAVLDTLRDLGCSIAERAEIYSLIRSSTVATYQQAIESGKVKSDTPLCFRSMALKANLQQIIEQYRAGKISSEDFSIKSDGDIQLDTKHKLEIRMKKQ